MYFVFISHDYLVSDLVEFCFKIMHKKGVYLVEYNHKNTFLHDDLATLTWKVG